MVKRKGGGFKKVHLSEFLGDAPITPVVAPPRIDECSTDLSIQAPRDAYEEDDIDLSALPSAPRAQREGSFDPSKVPRYPPFTAFVGNLPFDSEDEDVQQLFKGIPIKEVRLMKDKENGHFKGFGYVEFDTAEGLIEALKMNERLVRNRPIKVDIATTGNRDGGGSSGDRWERGDRGDDRERKPYVDTTSDDWRRDVKPQDERPDVERRRYDRDDHDDRSTREYNGGERRERPPREDTFDNFSRADFGSKINDEPKEPYQMNRGDGERGDRDRQRPWGRGGGDGERDTQRPWGRAGGGDKERDSDKPWGRAGGEEKERDSDKPWGRGGGEERERDSDKPWGRGGGEDRERDPQKPWGRRRDDEDRPPRGPPSKADAGPWERTGGTAADVAPTPAAPAEGERPRLNIKPRSARGPTGSDKPKVVSNPFGGAKPADTASWRSARVQGTGPITTPKPQAISIDKAADNTDQEIITDSNKFMVLDEEEDKD